MNRRDFVRMVGLGAAALTVPGKALATVMGDSPLHEVKKDLPTHKHSFTGEAMVSGVARVPDRNGVWDHYSPDAVLRVAELYEEKLGQKAVDQWVSDVHQTISWVGTQATRRIPVYKNYDESTPPVAWAISASTVRVATGNNDRAHLIFEIVSDDPQYGDGTWFLGPTTYFSNLPPHETEDGRIVSRSPVESITGVGHLSLIRDPKLNVAPLYRTNA